MNKAWTDEENAILLEGVAAGLSSRSIVETMLPHRTAPAIKYRLAEMRAQGVIGYRSRSEIAARAAAKSRLSRESEIAVRRCLACQRDFESWGIGNRICDRCKRSERFA